MAITTLDGLIASVKQRVPYVRTASRTSVAGIPFSVFDLAGFPGAGTLAVGNTANGVVPTPATAGYPVLPTPAGNLYLSRLDARNSVAGWLDLYETLFSCGAYAFNAAQVLSAQPSYSGRLPIAGDYTGLELWLETVTAFTGNQSIRVRYLDQGGAAGDTGTLALGVAPTLGRMTQLPLAAGDSGVQQITNVDATVATVGTFNVHVLRHLAGVRINAALAGEVHDFARLGLPRIFANTCLRLVVTPDSTATGLPALRCETSDG